MKYLLMFFLGWCLVFPGAVHAAPSVPTVSFDMPAEIHGVGDIVPVTIRLSTDGLNLNALELVVNYSTVGLEIVRVEKSLTNFPLWPEEPAWDNASGQLRLSAGRPNGLIAVGASVGTIYVKLQASGLWQFLLMDSSRGFANDGQGTPTAIQSQALDIPVVELAPFGIELSSSSHPSSTDWYAKSTADVTWSVDPKLRYSFTWSADPSVVPNETPKITAGQESIDDLTDGVWWFTIKSFGADGSWSRVTRRAFQVDTSAPESFTIQQLPADQVGGQTVVAWSAKDTGSGIASYQLALNSTAFGPVISPLTVRQEWQGKTLTIQALDGAGNTTSASWRDTRQPFSWLNMVVAAAIILGAGLTSYIVIRARRQRLS